MTTQELLHIFALDIQEGMSDDQIGEQAEHLAKKIEALVRKETIEEIYREIHFFDYNNKIDHEVKKILNTMIKDAIKKYAQSKGITL